MQPSLNAEAPSGRLLPVDAVAPTHVETATFATG
jgi:hypothetical protein